MQINGFTISEEAFLGKGTFGTVYKAEKEGKTYAIKVIQTDFIQTEIGKARFQNEIKALQKVDCNNVVKFYETGSFIEKGFEWYYIVMEYIDGVPLSNYIGRLKEDQVIVLLNQLLNGIRCIHESGIIHRDLKPQNIFIENKTQRVVILDFGLAKLIDYSSITQTGDRIGTFAYMSPEQITDSKNIDNRSDYFSLGVILYELVTGVRPFDATNVPALTEQIKFHYPKPPSDLNPTLSNNLENTILKLLEKLPFQRFQDQDELFRVLEGKFAQTSLLSLQEIRFIVRLLHNEKAIAEEGIQKKYIDYIDFPSNFFNGKKPTLQLLQNSGVILITDPATNRLNYTAFTKTKGVKELPYSSGSDVTPLQKKDFQSITQIEEYVTKVLNFQLENKVKQLTAPFFYFKNTNDEWFSINLKLLRESLKIRDTVAPGVPIWGSICTNIGDWYDDSIKNTILNQYSRWAPDGYLVYPGTISNSTDEAQLFHYTDMVLKLQNATKRPVISCRTNSFGLILLSLGLNGISSGIASLDTFYEDLLCSTEEGYNLGVRYYVPSLMALISFDKGIPTKLFDLYNSTNGSEFKCDCPYCKDIKPANAFDGSLIKKHFLYHRKKELDKINGMNSTERKAFILSKLEIAIKLHAQLKIDGIKIMSDTSYLRNWKSIVEKF